MKKLWLFFLLLICGISLTWCFKIMDWDWMIDPQRQPSYEVLEWTWYACFEWWCDSESYYERELVQYTNPELWLRITTPKYLDIFECTDNSKEVFFQSGNTIFAIDCKNEDIPVQEFITMYTKNPEESLENIIKNNYINDGCIYTNYLWWYGYYQVDDPEKWISWVSEWMQYFTTHNKEACDYWWYDIIMNEDADDTLIYEDLINSEMIYIFYIESEDKTRYYKILQKTSPVWWRTVFWKIELLNYNDNTKQSEDILNNEKIIHNTQDWTITLDNWEESITIMDRNLWAEIAWTWEESYGYYFQWWNNHWFSLNSEIKTWKDLVTRDVALQYWPNNWYDSDVQFVVMDNYEEINSNINKGNYFLAAVNDNLWWWSGDSEIVKHIGEYVIDMFRWDTGNPRVERQWPCPEWFHVPSFWEIHKLFKLWIDIKYPNDIEKKEQIRWMSIWGNEIWKKFSNDLLLPMAWAILFDGKGTPNDQESVWYYWMSSPSRFLHFWNDAIVEYAESYRAATFPVRCFKD